MMTGRNSRSLLTEILFAVLFFALSCAVLLGIFEKVHAKHENAKVTAQALVIMKNLAERLYAEEDEEAFLLSSGFTLDGDAYTNETDGITVNIAVSREETAFGCLRKAEISACFDDALLGMLSADRYFPKGAGA